MPLRLGEHGAIYDVNRHLLAKLDLRLLPRIEHRMEECLWIAFLLGQERIGKLERLMETDAAMAEIALVAREQVLGRRVVQIDVVFVREHELHQPERIAVRWRLLEIERKGPRVISIEIH